MASSCSWARLRHESRLKIVSINSSNINRSVPLASLTLFACCICLSVWNLLMMFEHKDRKRERERKRETETERHEVIAVVEVIMYVQVEDLPGLWVSFDIKFTNSHSQTGREIEEEREGMRATGWESNTTHAVFIALFCSSHSACVKWQVWKQLRQILIACLSSLPCTSIYLHTHDWVCFPPLDVRLFTAHTRMSGAKSNSKLKARLMCAASN